MNKIKKSKHGLTCKIEDGFRPLEVKESTYTPRHKRYYYENRDAINAKRRIKYHLSKLNKPNTSTIQLINYQINNKHNLKLKNLTYLKNSNDINNTINGLISVAINGQIKPIYTLFDLINYAWEKIKSEKNICACNATKTTFFVLPEMVGKVSLFGSGKMISVGTKSEKQAFDELQLATEFLVEKKYIESIKLDIQIQNLIVSADFGRSVNLEALSEQEKVIYEPEQFPAAIVRVEKPHKTTILVFASGKTVITGLKSEVQVLPTIDKIEEIIDLSNKYRMH